MTTTKTKPIVPEAPTVPTAPATKTNFAKPVFTKPNFGGKFGKNQRFPMPTLHRGVR